MTVPGGWPHSFPSDLFWASQDVMSPDDADAAALRILAAADLAPENATGLRMLDVGCGRGEVAIALARMGAVVTGVDSDALRIEEAAALARTMGVPVDFLHCDATRTIPDAPYALAYCHYTGWGYGGSESVRATMAQVRRALAPDGCFVVEGFDADAVVEGFRPSIGYARTVDGRSWNVSVDATMKPAANGGVPRLDQEWRYVSPGGTFHAARAATFEPLGRTHLSILARSVGLQAPVEVAHGAEARSITGAARMMLRFARAVDAPASELARRIRAVWTGLERTTPAVMDLHGGLTGRDMLDVSTRLEIALAPDGLPERTPVVILVPRSWAWPAAILAARSAGAVFCPIDPDQPDARIDGVVERLRPSAVVCLAEDADRFARDGDVRVDVLAPGPMFEDLAVLRRPGWRIMPEGTSHVFHTSGSTGMPKGVMLREDGLLDAIDAQRRLLPCAPGASLWALGPGFDASLSDVLCPVLSGRTLRVHRAKASRLRDLRQALERVDSADLPPAMLGLLAHQTGSMEAIVFGGERADGGVASGLGGVPYGFQAYGPTEASVCMTAAFPCEGWRLGLLGRPLVPGTTTLLVDGTLHSVEDARDPQDPNAVVFDPPLPDGATGEIVARGRVVAIGYLDAPEHDAKRFPTIGGERVHATGDMARVDGRHLIWTGRADRQVKINGRMVCPEEIEAAVPALVPGARARVIVQGDRIVLFVAEAEPPSDLSAQVVAKLGPTFRPARVVAVGSMPIGTSGKPDDAALLEMIA
jgi:acyl-CoA synthetase (AMP-forming)/AMP-acid ligase II/SAM-dependent methyltransferase